MPAYRLRELEKTILKTVSVLRDKAYGVSILEEIEEQLEKPVNVGAVQSSLRRLENQGYIKSWLSESTAIRGGRRKRFFTITYYGQKAFKTLKKQQVSHDHTLRSMVFISATKPCTSVQREINLILCTDPLQNQLNKVTAIGR